ncbi:MAG: DUF1934 domain-containing protein [Firmicutes bacterium]|nr:DUF1934 domain-containing protein [Bacillota bacterium]
MKDITLKIVGKQIYRDIEEEQIEFVTEGKLYEKGDSLYLIYEESEFSGMPGCKTSLKVTGNSLRMKRLGTYDASGNTAIQFEKGKRYRGLYDTPYGAIEMEVLTNYFKKDLDSEGRGTIDIDYNISLKGLSESRSTLNIEVM